MRAVSDAIAFVADSKTSSAERLWERSRSVASAEMGFDVDDEFLPMWRSVFSATVAALVEWDFATGFEHLSGGLCERDVPGRTVGVLEHGPARFEVA